MDTISPKNKMIPGASGYIFLKVFDHQKLNIQGHKTRTKVARFS